MKEITSKFILWLHRLDPHYRKLEETHYTMCASLDELRQVFSFGFWEYFCGDVTENKPIIRRGKIKVRCSEKLFLQARYIVKHFTTKGHSKGWKGWLLSTIPREDKDSIDEKLEVIWDKR
jgi:hypothetical protein